MSRVFETVQGPATVALILIAAALLLAGCGGAEMRSYQASANTYKACVQAKGPESCQSEKALMDTDERVWRNRQQQLNPGRTITVNS